MNNLKYIILNSALVLSPLACSSEKNAEHPTKNPEYQIKRDERIPHIQGFGELTSMDKKQFPINMHQIYQTSSGHYVGKNGASLYLFDGKTGQLLTHGSHRIMRIGLEDKFITSTGSDLKEEYTPRTLKEFTEEDQKWMKDRVEERNNGLYIKNWSKYKK